MKYLVILATILVIGCSTAPSKLERIEALENENAVQQSQIQENMKNINANTQAIEDQDTKIDRMFEKSQYK